MNDNNAINDQRPTTNDQRPTTNHHAVRKRILFVHHDRHLRGGAGLACLNTILDMKARHHDIEMILLVPEEGELAEKCRENNIEVIVSRFFGWTSSEGIKGKIKWLIKFLLNNLFYTRRVLNLFKNKHFDIIHSNTSCTQIGNQISKRLGIPHIWHIREFCNGFGEMDYGFYSKSYVCSQYNRSESVIMISRSIYEYYVNSEKLCKLENSRIIYNGLRISESYDKTYNAHINFCIAGVLISWKNQIAAVETCIKLRNITDKFTLNIIGDYETPYGMKLKQFVDSQGLGDYIKLWGFRYDINEILKSMDVGLMLSTREPFGRVTVEYMMNYMPVIAFDSGAVPEIVIDGDTGYICSLNDIDKLAELMHKFIMNPELIREMGTKGRERAVKNFSLERNTDEVYKLYQEILSR